MSGRSKAWDIDAVHNFWVRFSVVYVEMSSKTEPRKETESPFEMSWGRK